MADNVENSESFKDSFTDITKVTKQTRKTKNNASVNNYICLSIAGVVFSVIFTRFLAQNSSTTELGSQCNSKPKYAVYGDPDVQKQNGILHNIHTVLQILGYEQTNNESSWNLLWTHNYPFKKLSLNALKPHQKVNHFPGIGCITYKADLSTSDLKSMPKAFKLPKNKEQFLQYASGNKNAMFVIKNNHHRHVMLKNVSEIDLENNKSFVQEYVQKPLLVDGYKFDLGVYIALTSVDPLRVYAYKGDVAFRYCLEPYYPFDPTNLKSYVIASDYRPTWNVPALARLFKDLGFSHKDTFETYIRSKGIDLSQLWENVDKTLTELFITKEKDLKISLENYKSKENFFELMRVDMIVDENLKVYLMEANLCPNLDSNSHPLNERLFKQILYNLFSLVGVASSLNGYSPEDRENEESMHMISADNNIAVWSSECNGTCVECAGPCALCRGCLAAAPDLRRSLLRAHTEHLRRGDFRRLVPPSMTPNTSPKDLNLDNLSPMNELQYLWYQGKCNVDSSWCS